MSRAAVPALFALLVLSAGARLLLQIAAMPPYAGLDEGYHAARLAFVRAEHRNPRSDELSIPPYMAKNLGGDGLLPAFGELRERWPGVVRARAGRIAIDRPFTPSDLSPYVVPNYESQQPSLYYSAVARVGGGSALRELRTWRLTAAALALLVIVCTAFIGYRFFGTPGILAGAVAASFPTWHTLLLRTSNDAPACAFVAAAIAITASVPRKPFAVAAEALAWAGAVAAKLYTWPIAIVFPLFWRRQRGTRARFVAVSVAAAAAAVATLRDLASRTHNPLGHFGFDPVTHAVAQPKAIDFVTMAKITFATFVWTSGQHADALKLGPMLVYFVPIAMAVAAAGWFAWRRRESAAAGEDARSLLAITLAALVAFGIAHVLGAMAFIRQARASGLSLPLGGKEGWYWYSLVPLLAGILLSLALRRWRLLALWIVAWDVIINECALFHDWAGTSSPALASVLFRWGPLHMPFTAVLDTIGVGPFASHLVVLRAVHLAALAALLGLESLLHQRTTDEPASIT